MTRVHRNLLVLFLTLVTASFPAAGQSWIGLHSSPKWAGVSGFITTKGGESRYRSDLLLDMNGVFRGWNEIPGIRLRLTRDYLLLHRDLPTGTSLYWLAGPGLTLGYLSDSDNIYGFLGGLTIESALFLDFARPFSVCMGLSADFGLHYRMKDHHGVLQFYRNGVYRAYYPEIMLLYRF